MVLGERGEPEGKGGVTPVPCPGCNNGPETIRAYVGHQTYCRDCIDLTPDSGELSRLAGHGATAAEAVENWNEQVQAYLDARSPIENEAKKWFSPDAHVYRVGGSVVIDLPSPNMVLSGKGGTIQRFCDRFDVLSLEVIHLKYPHRPLLSVPARPGVVESLLVPARVFTADDLDGLEMR